MNIHLSPDQIQTIRECFLLASKAPQINLDMLRVITTLDTSICQQVSSHQKQPDDTLELAK